jgi:hypothetical protein
LIHKLASLYNLRTDIKINPSFGIIDTKILTHHKLAPVPHLTYYYYCLFLFNNRTISATKTIKDIPAAFFFFSLSLSFVEFWILLSSLFFNAKG